MNSTAKLKLWSRTTGNSIRVKSARFHPPKGKSILVCVEGAPSAWTEQFVRIFQECHPRENVFLLDGSTPNLPLCNGASIPYPLPFSGVTRRFLRRMRARLILVDRGASPPKPFLASALNNDISIAYLEQQPGNQSPEINSKIRIPYQSPTVISGLGNHSGQDSIEIVAPVMAREMAPDINLKKRIKFFLWEKFFIKVYGHRLRKLKSFSEINTSLGNPTSILCLGNGPSSEDPRLASRDQDSVFRVNHRWLDRGQFTAPDAIFTGALDSVLHVGRNVLYTFIDDGRAMSVIRKAGKKIGKLSFTNALDLGFPVDDFLPYQPTNGLVMIYVAVNLRPDSLTVAGIDLYRDPRGCYPGETTTPNEYTSGHNADKELDVMLRLLASYQGNLTIIGESLAYEYERYRNQERDQT